MHSQMNARGPKMRPHAVTTKTTAIMALYFVGGLASPPTLGANALFSDQTQGAGLSFTHQAPGDIEWGEQHGGMAVGDFNRDGWPDLFVAGGGLQPDALFINNQDGTFTDEAPGWGLSDLYRGNGVAAGDFDKDGWVDVYVSSHGAMAQPPATGDHRLYRNNGDSSFTNVAVAAGVNSTSNRPEGYSANFGDYDLDGYLDLWVAGWHTGLPNPPRSRLFRNRGDGTFEDVTVSAGADTPNDDIVGQFSGAFADMNGDRYPELVVSGDWGNSHYLRNNRDGTFTDVDIFQPHAPWNGMGHALGDFNRDGRLDWFITAAWPAFGFLGPEGNRLYVNSGSDSFLALPESAGVEDGGWGWGAASVDVDHDGWQDLVMTNGWPYDDDLTGASFTNEPSYIFHNDGNLSFTEIGQSSGFNHTGQGRGIVYLDYDRDGDLDLIVSAWSEPLQLFRNDISGTDANWLKVTLDTSQHPVLAPDGFGSEVQISVNGVQQYFHLTGASHYLATSQLVAHFGLGSASSVDTLRVRWADGFDTVVQPVAANQHLTVQAQPPLRMTRPVIRGGSGEVSVAGVQDGETAHVFFSPYGPGEGVCLSVFGGRCLGLLGARYAGNASADGAGDAALSIAAPPGGQAAVLYVQVMVRRGTDGAESIISNILQLPVIDLDEG